MSERIHVLAQQLLNQPSVAECSLQAVRELAERYPYFAPAQFLLLEKLRETGDPAYATQLQKAVLYYHDPVSFDYFLSSDQFLIEPGEATPEKSEPEQEAESSIQEAQIERPVDEIQPEAPATDAITPAPETEDSALPVPQPVPALAFEPYHTVDYFASQGIKLSDREVGQDKFGKQLRSFTEWLKTMKQLPRQEAAPSIDLSTEKNVEHLAAHSVDQAEIVTEAMAEVWVKQGNFARATEIYRKLSLLNPSKNAYFAAKIDQIKSST